jgi:hypothetical protein
MKATRVLTSMHCKPNGVTPYGNPAPIAKPLIPTESPLKTAGIPGRPGVVW